MTSEIQKQIGWPAVIGMGIGGIGVFVGLAATFSEDVGAGIFFTVMLIGVSLLVWFVAIRPFAERNRLLKNGISAEATIISLAENGSSIKMGGAIPKAGVTVQLDVHSVGKPAYRTQTNMYISMFEMQKFQPGATVQVKVDPANPHNVAIVDGTQPLASFDSAANEIAADEVSMTELEELMMTQKELLTNGTEAKAIVKTARETGLRLNGDDPVMEFTLEVHPTTGESFTATTKGLVMRSAVEKCQRGHEITVKYNPTTKRVMVVHS